MEFLIMHFSLAPPPPSFLFLLAQTTNVTNVQANVAFDRLFGTSLS
jgi:hypothetical protein